MIPRLHNRRTMSMNCAFFDDYAQPRCYVMYVMTNLRHHYCNSYRMTKNVGILNPFEVTESTTLAVQSTVDKNKYFTILVFRQHYTNLDTCPKAQPYERVHENRLRSIVSICEEQFGFVKGKPTH